MEVPDRVCPRNTPLTSTSVSIGVPIRGEVLGVGRDVPVPPPCWTSSLVPDPDGPTTPTRRVSTDPDSASPLTTGVPLGLDDETTSTSSPGSPLTLCRVLSVRGLSLYG